MIRTVVFISCLLFVTKCVQSQNYIQQYPINAIIDNAGNQNRIIFSVYDSVLASIQYYFTPYYPSNLLISNNGGAFVGYKQQYSSPADSAFGYITYDHLIHQFSAFEQFHSAPLSYSIQIHANDAGLRYVNYFNNPAGVLHQTIVTKYDFNQKNWIVDVTYPVQEFGVSNISMWAMTLEKSDLQIGVGTIGIFDPAIYSIEYAYVGCFFAFDSWTDDYFVPDPGPCEKFSVYAYNSYLHSWNSFHETIDSHGAMYKGIFHAILHHAPFHNHFGYYDEFLNEWKRDTLDHELNGIIRIKDRIITFVDSTTAGTKVHFRTYDFNSHSFIKDSINAPLVSNLSLQNGTVQWNDSTGTHIRGYNDSLGWGNYPTTIVPQFYLTDLYAQTGLPIIHVRDYTIGTDNVVFDFGDGTTSINNGHVLWHQYNGAGPFTVSVSNISGTASQSQSISFPCFITYNKQNSCSQICNGSIELIPPSTSTQYSLIWNTGDTLTTLDSLCPGNYIYTFTDTSGCIESDTIQITAPTINVVTNHMCADECIGNIAVSYTEGLPQTTYLWNTGETVPYLSGLCAGTYTLIVTSANQCIDTISATVDSSFTMSATVVSPNCYNFNYGSSITINASGGQPPYEYFWPALQWNSNPLVNEGAGVFELYLSDHTGCTDTFMITVPDPPQIVITSTSVNPSCAGCSDGIIALNILNATPPYNITWSPNFGTLSGDSIINLKAGIYFIEVTDVNSCVKYFHDTLFVAVDINEIPAYENVSILPNPASDKIMINFNSPLTVDCEISIHDALGQVMLKEKIIRGVTQTEIDISHFSSSIYFIEISGGGSNWYRNTLIKY